jgi:hypothetical protein
MCLTTNFGPDSSHITINIGTEGWSVKDIWNGTVFLYDSNNNSIVLMNAVTLQIHDVWIESFCGVKWERPVTSITVSEHFICVCDNSSVLVIPFPVNYKLVI